MKYNGRRQPLQQRLWVKMKPRRRFLPYFSFLFWKDDDLEKDINKLLSRPELDRPESELNQYMVMCPELQYNIQVRSFLGFDFPVHPESCCMRWSIMVGCLFSSDFKENELEPNDELKSMDIPGTLTGSCLRVIPCASSLKCQCKCRGGDQSTEEEKQIQKTLERPVHREERKQKPQEPEKRTLDESEPLATSFRKGTISSKGHRAQERLRNRQTSQFQHMNSCALGCQEGTEASEVVTKLLERHPGNIPFHKPSLFMARANRTRSIPDYRALAFPDLWGHQPPPYSQPLQQRRCGIQK